MSNRRRQGVLKSLNTAQTIAWNRNLYDRVGSELRPESIQSALVIVPGSSGDVALATTVVRYIKDRNPNCRVSFIVKRSNLPLLKMCPGVDEAIEWHGKASTSTQSRHDCLASFVGRADVVICPICIFEDIDLLQHYNFLETIWLLAGIPNGIPPLPQKLWLMPPVDPEISAAVLRRCLHRDHSDTLIAEAFRQPGKLLSQVRHLRKLRDIGWRTPIKLLRHASYIRSLSVRADLRESLASQFVILSSEATVIPRLPKGLFEKIIRFLRLQGRIVLHNVLDPASAAPGTVPLICSYEEFLCLRAAGVPFVGWRSGLCDIAAAAAAPMCVLYPATMQETSNILQAHCGSLIKSFGLGSMNVAANCIEMTVNRVEDLDLGRIARVLNVNDIRQQS